MKKTKIFILCVATTLLIAACANKGKDSTTSQTIETGQTQTSQTQVSQTEISQTETSQTETGQTEIEDLGKVEIPNPFVECNTLEEAGKLAGFEITVPEQKAEEFLQRVYRVMEGKMIEVIDSNGEKQIKIRKALGDEDISGDYNQYSESYTTVLGDLQVTMKGDDKQVKTVVWTSGDFTYSISSSEAQTEDYMKQLIEQIH